MLTLLSSFRRGGLVFLALCGLLTSADAGSPMVIGGRCRQTGNSCDSTIGNAGGQGACGTGFGWPVKGPTQPLDCDGAGAASRF